MSSTVNPSASAVPSRSVKSSTFDAVTWFYPGTTALLLILSIVGFSRFYFHGRAYPDRPIDPRIHLTVFAHAAVMSAWIILMLV